MKRLLIVVVITLFAATGAFAGGTDIDLTAIAGSQSEFRALSEELGVGFSYKPTNPAAALGVGGFDLGLEVSLVDIDEGASYWQAVSLDVPSLVPVPKLHAIVGLPFGLDLGAIYSFVPDSDIRLYGASIKYAILKGGALTPGLGVRGAYTKLTGVDELDLSTASIDASVSKGFPMITPYAGIGQVWVFSKPSVTGLTDESFSNTKIFGGLKFSLLFLKATAEVEFATVATYTLKVGAGF